MPAEERGWILTWRPCDGTVSAVVGKRKKMVAMTPINYSARKYFRGYAFNRRSIYIRTSAWHGSWLNLVVWASWISGERLANLGVLDQSPGEIRPYLLILNVLLPIYPDSTSDPASAAEENLRAGFTILEKEESRRALDYVGIAVPVLDPDCMLSRVLRGMGYELRTTTKEVRAHLAARPSLREKRDGLMVRERLHCLLKELG